MNRKISNKVGDSALQDGNSAEQKGKASNDELFTTTVRGFKCDSRRKFQLLKANEVIGKSMNQMIIDLFHDEVDRLYNEFDG